MRTFALLVFIPFVLLVTGCGLTQEEIASISAVVSREASEKAAKLALEEAKKAGLSDEAANAAATVAGETAGKLASEAAAKLAEKLPAEKGEKTGGSVLSILWFLAQTVLGIGIGGKPA